MGEDCIHKSGIAHIFNIVNKNMLQHLINGYLFIGSIHSTVTE